MGEIEAVAMNEMDRGMGRLLAVSLKSRGVAQLDLCLHHVFELLWLREREKEGEWKQNHKTSS